ncbi:hypothetical protein PYW07_008414 [Mythimna separata]|uniref:Regulatory protein zeste n=1 Tax=Mythimna separata TaxID=271217 RepID=A0AAD7YDH7_MYTSE|nr:hypothetical protein PYW07_008414 [Mythimna separata]
MSNRPSQAQLECLAEFLEQNPGIAKGLLRTTQGKVETKRKWENLSTTLNSLGGAKRNGQGWAKYWAEKKCAIKKQCAEVSASMRRTGGAAVDNLPMLSALDKRLVAVTGGQEFSTGDARWTVNPFPQSPRPTDSPVVIEHVELVQEDMAMDSRNISPIPGTSQNDTIPATSTSTVPAPQTPLQRAIPPQPRRRRPSIRMAVLRLEKQKPIVKHRVNITKEREPRKKSEDKDEYTMYGELVAMKLKKIENSYARSTAQYHINNILYKAEIGAFDKPQRQNRSQNSKECCTAQSSTANLDLNDYVESPRSSSPAKSPDYDLKVEESDESSS